MSDQITDLLREVADGVEPGDRLDAIRSETAGARSTGRGWWAAGGVGLIAASVVTAMVVTTGGAPQRNAPDPAEPAPSRTTATTGPLPQETTTVPVYYVGDTPDGPRLYREFRRVEGDPLDSAVAVAVGTAADGRPAAPLDPDYRVPWPARTTAMTTLSLEGGVIEISLGGDPEGSLHDRGQLSEVEAGLAVEQLIRTAQGVVGERLPVRFLLDGEITDKVLGVPASEPLAQGSDLAVLSHVSLTAPAEGRVVDNDGGMVVDGLANSFEGNVVITVERLDDGEVLVEEPTIAGTYEDRLFPFTERLDVFDLPAGDYVVRARTDDPSGESRFHEDSRTVTIVD